MQQAICGHRGRVADPLYGIRRILLTLTDLLTDKQKDKLATALDGDDAHLPVEVTAWCFQDLIAAHADTNKSAGKLAMFKCLKRIRTGLPAGLEEWWRHSSCVPWRWHTRRPRQTVGELLEDLLVGALRIQCHPDREIRRHASGQRPTALPGPPAFRDHLIDQGRGKHPGQQTHRHHIRQPPIRDRLHPSTPRHTSS